MFTLTSIPLSNVLFFLICRFKNEKLVRAEKNRAFLNTMCYRVSESFTPFAKQRFNLKKKIIMIIGKSLKHGVE